MKVRLILIMIFSFSLADLILSQDCDTLIYENFYKQKRELLPGLYLTRYYLLPDSSYIYQRYWGQLDDSRANYKDWQLTESKGLWQIDKNTLILRRGDMVGRYKITNRYFKRRRIQTGLNGYRGIQYKKWPFEKRAKFKRIINDAK